MDMSFYNAAAGASAHQSRIDYLANNIANANTYGYKAKAVSFSDLLYSDTTSNGGETKVGSGTKTDKAYTDFAGGNLVESNSNLDFSIEGRGFFGLLDQKTNQVYYTRKGSFTLSQKGEKLYFASQDGYLVLGKNGQPIEMTGIDDKVEPGVFEFPREEGLLNAGSSNFLPVAENGTPYVKEATVRRGFLESSNVDLPKEMTMAIEAQRAYSYSLKVLQTSDEIQELINNLR